MPSSSDTCLEFLHNMVSNTDRAMALCSKDLVYQISPRSLKFPPNNHARMTKMLKNGFKKLDFKIADVTESKDGSKVVVECDSTGIRGDGSPYANQYIFIFRMKDGKIVHVNEFVDSDNTKKVLKL